MPCRTVLLSVVKQTSALGWKRTWDFHPEARTFKD